MAILGVLALALAIPVGVLVSELPSLAAWAANLQESAAALKAAVPSVLLDLARLAKPLLVIATAAMFLACLRQSRRHAAVFVAVVLLTNGSVQLLKRLVAPHVSTLAAVSPMSGHVALVTGLALGWLAVTPRDRLVGSTAWAVGAVVAVSAGVMLAGWHTPGQVICGLLLAVGWALLGRSALDVSKHWSDRTNLSQTGLSRAR